MRLRRYRDRGVVAIATKPHRYRGYYGSYRGNGKIEATETILWLYSKRARLCCAHSLALFFCVI